MKKILLLVLTSLIHSCAIFAQETFISENWENCQAGTLPEGWTSTGTDKTPAGAAADLFSYGEGMKVMTLPGVSSPFAVSYSSTLEGGKVNTTLTSPTVAVPESGAVLSFYAVNYNPAGSASNKICVYVEDSASGERSKAIISLRVPSNNIASPKNCTASLSDYAGKEIRLVFANEGTDAGLLGIGSVTVAQYIASVTDMTQLFSTSPKERPFNIQLNIFAPSNGVTATLTTSNGTCETLELNSVINEDITTITLPFTNVISLNSGDMMVYTVTITPACAPDSQFTYSASTGCGEGFPSVVVEEEGTGERCGYCPAGAAGIEKFSDMFGNRFIGIAIHCVEAFSTGVMENPEYADPFVYNRRFPVEGLPFAVLNRAASGSPTTYGGLQEKVERLLAVNSVATTRVESTTFDSDSKEMTVRFNTTLALPLSYTDFKAAVVLLADSLTGNSRNWYQHNYFSGTSEEKMIADAGEDWWPYMKFYCEYPAEIISPTDMRYNHVAMGIYPDFNGNGCPLPSDWTEEDSCSNIISFTVPMQEQTDGFGVQDIANTSVVAMIIDSRSGEIIAADKMHAADYVDLSGIATAETDPSMKIVSKPGALEITTSEESVVNVYSPLGVLIASSKTSDGSLSIEIPSKGEMLIVTSSNGASAKIIH